METKYAKIILSEEQTKPLGKLYDIGEVEVEVEITFSASKRCCDYLYSEWDWQLDYISFELTDIMIYPYEREEKLLEHINIFNLLNESNKNKITESLKGYVEKNYKELILRD